MDETRETLLRVEDLSVSFAGKNFVQAVEHVSLEVRAGDRLCIIGETGQAAGCHPGKMHLLCAPGLRQRYEPAAQGGLPGGGAPDRPPGDEAETGGDEGS